MLDLILVTNVNYGLKEFMLSLKTNPLIESVTQDGDGIFIEFAEEGFVQIRKTDRLANYYEVHEMKVFKENIDIPTFYLVHFKNINLVKIVLKQLGNSPNVFIDNDHDVILPGNEFIKLMKAKPDWDWTHE